MDINRYAAFVAAVETKSMSGAAKQLGYTPSGIIRLINALEEELGFQVLARSSTGVAATPEGEKLLPMYRDIIQLQEQANQTSIRIRGLAEGDLTIGALSSINSVWLPAVITKYQEKFPGVRVNVVGGSDARLLKLLDDHSIDCCIFHGDHSRLDWTPLGHQELMAWLPANDPLTRHGSIMLAELDGKPFIRIHPEGATFAERLLRERNIEPDIRFTATDPFAAYCMVDANLGVTLCCNGLTQRWKGNVEIRPLSPQQFIEFGIGYLPSLTPAPAVEEFIAIAKEFTNTWPAQ